MTAFVCPICRKELKKSDKSAVCENGHVFDYSKEKYLNLLTANEKNSLDPGDNKEMVAARKSFLEKNYYLPLAKEIDSVLSRECKGGYTLLDAGVGTGFYLSNISGAAKRIGIDISKHAVKYAAKRNPDAECAVASVFNLPIKEESIDAITCVFSPYAFEEYARVLKKGGILVVASPSENHLIELRKALYDNVREVNNKLETELFAKLYDKQVTYSFEIVGADDIASLIKMTPYAYRAPIEKIEELSKRNKIKLTADFWVSVFRK